MTKKEFRILKVLNADFVDERPRTRGECASVPRPCPFVSCHHHLFLDVGESTGSLKRNFPDIEPDQLPANKSCALDVADEGGSTLEYVGECMNLTRERVRQVEAVAVRKLGPRARLFGLDPKAFVSAEMPSNMDFEE